MVDRKTFTATIGFSMLSAMAAVVVVIGVASIFESGFGGPPRGTLPVLALLWLTVVWLGDSSWKLGTKSLVTMVAAGTILPLQVFAAQHLLVRLSIAGAAGLLVGAMYGLVSWLGTRFQLSGGLTAIGLISAVFLVGFVPSAVMQASGPAWVRAGLALGLLALTVVVMADGLGGERGRLRIPGFTVLGICSVLGLLGLFL